MDDDKDDRDASRLFPRQPFGSGHDLAGVEQGEFGEPAGTPPHHAVAGLDAGYAGPDLDHLAGGVAAPGARFRHGLAGANAQRMEPAEFRPVQRRRINANQDVTRRDDGSLHIADVPTTVIRTGNHDRGLHAFLHLPGTPTGGRMRHSP